MVDTDDKRCTMDDDRRTTPCIWHKLPTGELKNASHDADRLAGRWPKLSQW